MVRSWSLILFMMILPVVLGAGGTRDLGPATYQEMVSEKRVALVVGNGAYSSGPLRNPPNDAQAVAAALQELGFDVMLHIDLGYQDMRRAVVEFGTALQAGGVGLFFYAGHGIQHNGKNYLVPVDATIQGEAYIAVEAVDVNTVLAGMHEAHNRLNIVILDACRNNPFERSFRSNSGGLASIDAPSGTLIAYATAPGRTAEDGAGENSSYTAALVEQLGVPGAKVEDVFKRVRVEVQKNTGERQTPWETSSLTGDFYFVPSSGADGSAPTETSTPSAAVSATSGVAPVVTAAAQQAALLALVTDLSQARYGDEDTIVQLYADACSKGYQLACKPTWRHADGANLSEAGKVFGSACEGGDTLGCVVAGWAATQTRPGGRPDAAAPDAARGVVFFRQACDVGNMRGCSELGRLYSYGVGVAQDERRALGLYKSACDGGDLRGCTNLGIMLDLGSGTMEDDRQALSLFRRACDEGEPLGCSLLGDMYYEGRGVGEDHRQAASLYGKSCSGGYAGGCSLLATLYYDGDGVKQDDGKAAQWYRMACDGKDPLGCANLGTMAHSGVGVSQDFYQAASLYRLGCDGGVADACVELGFMYGAGEGVMEDDSKAVSLCRKACDAGVYLGCSCLGYQYELGEGISQDLEKAVMLYNKACTGGELSGCSMLASLYLDTDQHAWAVQELSSCCGQGYEPACEQLQSLGYF